MSSARSRGASAVRGQGSDEPARTTAPPVLPLDARSLRAAFQDLWTRPPLLAERARWSGGFLSQLTSELTGAPEFWAAWLREQLFYFLLVRNFRPESEGVSELPADLAAGRIGALGALHRIALSSAFDLRNPGADTFVTVVMEQLVGLEVQKEGRELEIGKRLYDGNEGLFLGKRGHSQADVVRIALEDERCPRTFLTREYRRIVRAEPPAPDLRRWLDELAREPLAYPSIVREWVVSAAWQERLARPVLQDNRLFVRGVFVDLFDRLPGDEELETLANALDGLGDPGPLRAVISRMLVDSRELVLPDKAAIADPEAWIAALFERLLGRAATPEELGAFVRTFADPDCRPATVLRAIVTHPDYHRY